MCEYEGHLLKRDGGSEPTSPATFAVGMLSGMQPRMWVPNWTDIITDAPNSGVRKRRMRDSLSIEQIIYSVGMIAILESRIGLVLIPG